jgi:predicted negative regulator of RcsB-dependent stress response
MIVLFTVNYFADANADAVITDSLAYSATQKVVQELQRQHSVPLQSFSELKDRMGDIYTQLSFLMVSTSLQNTEPGNIALASLLSLQCPN